MSFCENVKILRNIQWGSKYGFKGNDSLILLMLAPLGCFLCVKKQHYQGGIAIPVTNLRPLMSEQLIKNDCILYCLDGEYIS